MKAATPFQRSGNQRIPARDRANRTPLAWWALLLFPYLIWTATHARAQSGDVAVPGPVLDLGTRQATVLRLDALPYVESEYTQRFRFDRYDNPKLIELRKRYGLDAVIAPGRDEFDRQILLLDWTHQQFRRFGQPSTGARGALEVLGAIGGGHRFFCAQYVEVLVSAAASLGWVDRPLALRRHQGVAKVGGSTEHSVTEIWSNQYRKWVMLDPTSNLYLEREGTPLNAFEIRQEWFYRSGTNLVFVVGKERKRYRKEELPIVLKQFPDFGALAIHPDELDKYGFIGFIPNTDLMDWGHDYGGMFIIQDALCEGTSWHQRVIPREPSVDPYFPIGQAALELGAMGGEIGVRVQTLTPNLDHYEARMDGGDWRPQEARFAWPVHDGTNRLEVRTLNRFGIPGPVSTAVLRVAEGRQGPRSSADSGR